VTANWELTPEQDSTAGPYPYTSVTLLYLTEHVPPHVETVVLTLLSVISYP